MITFSPLLLATLFSCLFFFPSVVKSHRLYLSSSPLRSSPHLHLLRGGRKQEYTDEEVSFSSYEMLNKKKGIGFFERLKRSSNSFFTSSRDSNNNNDNNDRNGINVGKIENHRRSLSSFPLGKKLMDQYLQVLPATRIHLTLIALTTLVHLLGLPAPSLFYLDPSKVFPQIWRIVTSCVFLGPPSMSMVNNLYFLLRFGQALERSEGSATHLWFLIVQVVTLSTLGLLLGFPFQSKALVAAAVYAGSRINPHQRLNFQFGMQISSWQLPFYLMAIESLAQQSLSAAWPYAMGITSAHVFHFFRDIWPNAIEDGNRQHVSPLSKVFKTPAVLKKLFKDGGQNANVMDFRKPSNDIKNTHTGTKIRNILGTSRQDDE